MAKGQRKPRLLVVTSTYPRWAGDTEPSFVHQLASRLLDRFDIVVSTSRAPGAKRVEVMDGVKVFRYPYAPNRWETLVYGGGLAANLRGSRWKAMLLPVFLISWAVQLKLLNRRYHFNVVHAHWFVPGALLSTIMLREIPLCVTAHGSDVHGLRGAIWSGLRRFVARRSAAVTAVGTGVRSALWGECVAPVLLLPMGVDLSKVFVPTGARRRNAVLFVGRLVREKQPEIALQSFVQVLKTHPALLLDLVGDGPDKQGLERLADEFGIRSRVVFHGRKTQEEVATMYRSSAALLITSGGSIAPEGLALVAVEALGCGCPVVSVPNPALQALLPEGTPIRYACDETVEAIVQTLRASLESPVSEADVMGCAWREELVRRFDWTAVGGHYDRLLATVAGHGE